MLSAKSKKQEASKMNLDLSVITTNAIVIVPIVIAIVQAIKLTGWIPDHFSPLLAIAIGVIIGFLGDHHNNDLSLTILSGAVYGLMASGLYSGVKVTMEAHQQMKEQKKQQQKNKQPQQQQQDTVTETHEVYKQEKYNKH
jgi:hypothetical protein